jgi:hypothetical protein
VKEKLRYTSLSGSNEGDVCEGEDRQTEDDGCEPEGIELDSNEANAHGELKSDAHQVYEHACQRTTFSPLNIVMNFSTLGEFISVIIYLVYD